MVDEAGLADVCAGYGIARLLVFGSVARGRGTPDSDIDVLSELEPGHRLGLGDRTGYVLHARRLDPVADRVVVQAVGVVEFAPLT